MTLSQFPILWVPPPYHPLCLKQHSVPQVLVTQTKSICNALIYKQFRICWKIINIRLPKLIIVNMAGKCHHHASSIKENSFLRITLLEAWCQMVFLADSELSDQCLSHKGCPWNFWSWLKISGYTVITFQNLAFVTFSLGWRYLWINPGKKVTFFLDRMQAQLVENRSRIVRI